MEKKKKKKRLGDQGQGLFPLWSSAKGLPAEELYSSQDSASDIKPLRKSEEFERRQEMAVDLGILAITIAALQPSISRASSFSPGQFFSFFKNKCKSNSMDSDARLREVGS